MMKTWLVRASLALSLMMVMGFSDHKISSHNAESLNASLQTILQTLSQADRKAFLTRFFQRANYEYCLEHGRDYSHKTVRGPDDCAAETFGYQLPQVDLYLSDRRMDDKVEYVRSDLFGSTKHGHSANRSVVIFIDKYGKYVDGLSARQIVSEGDEIYDRGVRINRGDRAEAATAKIPQLESELAVLQANYPKIERVAVKHNIQRLQNQCRAAIESKSWQLAVNRAERDGLPAPEKPRGMYFNSKACMIVMGTDGWVNLSEVPGVRPARPGAPEPMHPTDAKYNRAVRLMAVTRMSNINVKAHSMMTKVEADFDIQALQYSGKNIVRANYQVMAIPKSGGDLITFKGLVKANGGQGLSVKGERHYATATKGAAVSENSGDYLMAIAVTDVKYADGSKEKLISDMGDFMDWVGQQQLQPQ